MSRREMAGLLHALFDVANVAVISGGSWAQFKARALSNRAHDEHLTQLSLLPISGTTFLAYDGSWRQLSSEDLSAGDRKKIFGALKKARGETGLEEKNTWGDVIEDQGSQIAFSALGQEAPLEAKAKWDPHFVYHGVSEVDESHPRGLCYSAEMMVLSKEHPQMLRYRSEEPVLARMLRQEREGVIFNVVFPTGIGRRDDLGLPHRIDVYYGMADNRIGVAGLDVPAHLLPDEAVADSPQGRPTSRTVEHQDARVNRDAELFEVFAGVAALSRGSAPKTTNTRWGGTS